MKRDACEAGAGGSDPRVSLALDNCFAKKRWCAPEEWIPLVRELGVRCVEASADNEIDPFFSLPEFVADWRAQVTALGARHGVRVAVCYSGHGTYSTLGLGHYDPRIRAHMRDDWFRPMITLAASLDAWLGFFAHAFDERTLRDPACYAAAYSALVDDIAALARYAGESGLRGFGVEQMYSPNQPPWTLDGAADFLRRCNAGGGAPVYITVDTGHQCGQRLFQVPQPAALAAYHAAVRAGRPSALYLGCREHEAAFRRDVADGMGPAELEAAVASFAENHRHLLARPEDGDLYAWVERLRHRCSPVIHLQQHDGRAAKRPPPRSPPPATRAGSSIRRACCCAVARSFAGPGFDGAPPPPGEVVLVLEPFLPTACRPAEWLAEIAESVAYWRRFVPEDGCRLGALVARLADDGRTDRGEGA